MDPRKARNIIMALSDLAVESLAYQTAFQDAVEVIIRDMNKATFSDLESILGIILRNMRRASYLYHAPLFEAAAELAGNSGWSLIECSVILRKLSTVVNIFYFPMYTK